LFEFPPGIAYIILLPANISAKLYKLIKKPGIRQKNNMAWSLSKFCSFENFGLVFVPDKAQFEDVASSYVRRTATLSALVC